VDPASAVGSVHTTRKGGDLVFDVLGGDIAKRSAGLNRAGGTLVTITGPTDARPASGLTIDFVVVPDRAI
jgi:hypothetical protein